MSLEQSEWTETNDLLVRPSRASRCQRKYPEDGGTGEKMIISPETCQFCENEGNGELEFPEYREAPTTSIRWTNSALRHPPHWDGFW